MSWIAVVGHDLITCCLASSSEVKLAWGAQHGVLHMWLAHGAVPATHHEVAAVGQTASLAALPCGGTTGNNSNSGSGNDSGGVAANSSDSGCTAPVEAAQPTATRPDPQAAADSQHSSALEAAGPSIELQHCSRPPAVEQPAAEAGAAQPPAGALEPCDQLVPEHAGDGLALISSAFIVFC
jgi:hypothetical protein